MRIPLIVLILQGFPEGIALCTLAFILAMLPLNWKKIIIGGILLPTIVYFIRLLPFQYGIHTVMMIALLFFYLVKVGKASITNSLISCLVSFFILCVAETTVMYIVISFFELSSQDYLANNYWLIITGLIHVFIIFIISFLIYNLRNKRKDINHDYPF